MPYFSIETNESLSDLDQKKLSKEASTFVTQLLGKPESYVMTAVKSIAAMSFAGSDEPSAFIEVKSIGLPTGQCSDMAGKICTFMHDRLGIPADRIFIDFKDLKREMFAFNGNTFA